MVLVKDTQTQPTQPTTLAPDTQHTVAKETQYAPVIRLSNMDDELKYVLIPLNDEAPAYVGWLPCQCD